MGMHLIAAMLIGAAGLDLARCSLVLMTYRHIAPTAGLVAAGFGAAALSLTAARGYRAGRRWAGWIALLIGVASAPQASASGFQSPDMIPDVATAALGVLLAVAILATVGRAHVAADRKPAGWRFSVRTGGEDSVGCEIEEKPQRPISTTTRS